MKPARVKFSVVVPLYKTEEYLPDLLKAFTRQKPGGYDVEYIFVNDGSPDDCAKIAKDWLREAKVAGEVLQQENAGISAARNRGIAAATGSWITFPDSDDYISDNYFREVAKAVQRTPRSVIFSANIHRYEEAKGLIENKHHLRYKFEAESKQVNLENSPAFIQSQAASAFFRMDLITANNVRFLDGLTVAEDAIFVSEYLLSVEIPLLVPVKNAEYYYRKRSAANSTADGYRHNPDYFFGRFERGYLPLLKKLKSLGTVPIWLQNTILYDLSWFISREQNMKYKATHLTEGELAKVRSLLREILAKIDIASILKYRITRLSAEVRALLLTFGNHPLPDSGMVRVSKNVPGAFEISYLYQGDPPAERFEARGRELAILSSKHRRLNYFGQNTLFERIVRLPAESEVSVFLDEKLQAISHRGYTFGRRLTSATKTRLNNTPLQSGTARWRRAIFRVLVELSYWTRIPTGNPGISAEVAQLRIERERTRIQQLAGTPRFRKKYGRGWLLMDRIRDAQDNGEYLYDFLRTHRPDINSWFVIERNSPPWRRLKNKGTRLIAYGSKEHKIALLLANLVASSHVDVEIVKPISPQYYPRKTRPWRFIYLQHGVIQHDLSHWFNGKDIDLLTTASVDEHESVIAPDSSYNLLEDAVELTGFPRHDVVMNLSNKSTPEDRKMILIAPTWRNELFLPKAAFGAPRKLRTPFAETKFGSQWLKLLAHPTLEEMATRHEAQLVFLPHPNLRGNLSDVEFPPYVTVIKTSADVQELVSRSRVTVTDYSSVAFEAAIGKSRVVYFQFDRDEFLTGAHTYSPGYWNYEGHGFGPVVTEVSAAAHHIRGAYEQDDATWGIEYIQRVARTFPRIDGEATHRIVDTIEEKFF